MINRISGDQLIGPMISYYDTLSRYSVRMRDKKYACPIATFDATQGEFERFSEAWQKLNEEQEQLDRKKEALRKKCADGGFKCNWFHWRG